MGFREYWEKHPEKRSLEHKAKEKAKELTICFQNTGVFRLQHMKAEDMNDAQRTVNKIGFPAKIAVGSIEVAYLKPNNLANFNCPTAEYPAIKVTKNGQ